MARRGISEAIVRQVMTAPAQRQPVRSRRAADDHSVRRKGLRRPRFRGHRSRAGRSCYCLSDEEDLQVLERATMKVTYDTHTDSLSVILKEGVPVAESDEDKPGVILDYDADGNLISIEVLDAARRITNPRGIEYQTTG
jgi:YD repeat-containing protein